MFLLFVGWNFYPQGGWADYHGTYDTLEDAQAALSKLECEWHDIVDIGGEIPVLVKEG